MKCYHCEFENKPNAKFCRGCGVDLSFIPWHPDRKWHLKTLGIIYVILVIVYFLARWLLAPYDRSIAGWDLSKKEAAPNQIRGFTP